jgi:hypothetical protein
MNITAIQAWLAPVLAPVAPALMFGNNLYNGLVADGMNTTIAGIGAVGGTIGVEVSGALACSMAVKAYHQKDTRVMWVSIASAVIYAVFVFAGIARAKNSTTFASAVFISLIAYLMLGVYQDYLAKSDETTKQNTEEIARMEAERKLTNSQTRKLKASGAQPSIVSSVSNVVQRGGQFQTDPLMVAAIRDYWKANPKATLREAAAACQCSPMTAGKYKL